MKNLIALACLSLMLSCEVKKEAPTTTLPENDLTKAATAHHIPEITRVFEAHGGYGTWSGLKTLSYELGGSTTLTDLQNRYTRIESEEQVVGFDGDNVWVHPASEDADRQRMRYNLMFYFYAFPFVVGDPGVRYEVLDQVDLGDKQYNQVKISYDDGVGDAPNDSYIICSDPETDQMEWLLYTATFGGEASEKYSLIKYENWQSFGGVLLPTSLQWYTYEAGVVGEPRGEARTFTNISVSTEFPDKANFEMPEGAAIAKLPAQ